MPKRSFRDSHKKIVAARQAWTCAHCKQLLSSAYQVDHTIPLWEGGEDDISNAVAVCSNCHSLKTQEESIRRTDLARRKFEESVVSQEVGSRKDIATSSRTGRTLECSHCGERRFSVFASHACKEVERRIRDRLSPPKKRPKVDLSSINEFERFRFVKYV